MSNITEPSADQLNAPYAERWGLLKDVMVQLYLRERKQLKQISEIMKIDYQFYASVSQYKHQFGVWNVKKALPTKKKKKVRQEMETRAKQGKSSVLIYNGKDENPKMRRYMKEQARRDISIRSGISDGAVDIEELSGHALQCGNRVMPGAVLRFLKRRAADHISPYASVETPMSSILVATPSSGGPSPRNHPSPANALSPNNDRTAMTATIQESLKISRAHLFVEKRHKNLLRGMNLEEQCITTDWMHQFWQYSFITAKNWGRGPQSWNASNLRFNQFSPGRGISIAGTPAINTGSPQQYSHHEGSRENVPPKTYILPSDLCRWSIHVKAIQYEPMASPPPGQDNPDPEDESTWRPWPRAQYGDSKGDFVEKLQAGLESNDFSTIEARDLPISVGQIVKAAKRSPAQLLEEAFGFSIMARNRDLINDIMEQIDDEPEFPLKELFPLHLASSYLDGSKSCCGMFSDIVQGMPAGENSIRKLYTNHLNHTVLDNLMIAILKAHSSCTPAMVDEAFKNEPRFAGEEVDICGRWDADSDCIRHLQACARATIPQSWKHMFCHTSVQAITHCIGTLFSPHWAPDVNTPSGLFLRRCVNEDCGLKLQLMPLHALVITAVYLAQLGSDGENLFGMIACLLCLLGKGANPLLKANISLKMLLGDDNSHGCTHSELDPLEFANSVPQHHVSSWPQERVVGWRTFCSVLRLSQAEWDPEKAVADIATSNPASKDGFRHIYSSFVSDADEAGILSLDADAEVGMEQHMHVEDMNVEDMNVEDMNGEDMNVEDTDVEDTDVEDSDLEEDDETNGMPGYCPDHWGKSFQNNYFGKNQTLATLWAAVQTEVLTYRRLNEGDPWLSANFDLTSVLASLESGEKLSIRLVSGGMMRPFCRCGVFREARDDPACIRVEQACARYFSNLEDWGRSTFLYAEEYRW